MDTEKLPQPPGGFGTRHLQTFLMSTSLMVAFGMRISISMAVVAMTDKDTDRDIKIYNWSPQEKSWILSAFLWGYAISQIPSGYLAGIWSTCKLFSIGLFVSSVVTFSTPHLADYGGFIAVFASRVFIGLTQACFLPCMHVLTSRWAPPLERSRISSHITSGATLGTVLAMALSGLIADSSLGWPGIFYIFGGAGIVMSIVFYSTVADSPAAHPSISREERTYITDSLRSAEDEEKKRPRPPWSKIFASLPMWAIIFAHMGNNWGSYTIQTMVPEYIKSVLKFNMTGNGYISSGYYVAAWMMCFPYSWLADYAVTRGVSVRMVRRSSNTLAMWGTAAALIVLCFVDSLGRGWPIAMLVLAGGMKAAAVSGFNVNHIDLSPNFAGALYAISNCFSTFVSIATPFISTFITDGTDDPGPWHMVFFLSAGIYIVSNLVYILLAQGETQSWNEKAIESIPDPIRRLSVLSLYDTKILTSVP